jgi:immunity protein 5 of polymorphic toxin system
MEKNDEQSYKWLVGDKISPIQGLRWPVGVGKWTEPTTPVPCQSGWHGMEERHVLTHLPAEQATLWVVEVTGKIVKADDKFAAESMKLVRPIGTTDDRKLRLLAADCAEDVLPLFLKVRPNDTRITDCIDVARRFAEGQATSQERAAARDAAGAAAWDAAGAAAGAAAWATTAALAAAWDAAGAAAWDAARAAAWAAAGDAAGAAAWDAARAAAWDAAGAKYSNWLVVRLESDFL